MLQIVNIHEAKTHLSKLIQEALTGEDIIIAKGNKPLVRLVVYEEDDTPRQGGQLAGMVRIGDDFDAPLPEDLAKFFEGRSE